MKGLVDPTRYKQVLSYRTTPMLPCVFEAEEESEKDLPCMLQTTTTTVTGTDDGFATPRNIVDLGEPAQGSQDACSTVGCLENLLDTFTRKDILNALAQKADNLQTDIRQGFDRDRFFVKSTSTSKPHIVQRVPGSRDGYICDKECLGFVSRKICDHTVAVANFSHNLAQCVS